MIRAVCLLTGFEAKEEKEEGPSTCLDELSREVDTIAWELRVSKKKLWALRMDLELWAQKLAA